MYRHVGVLDFVFALTHARDQSENIRDCTTHPTELSDEARYYLHADDQSGFGLRLSEDSTVELIAVFSLIKGRGQSLMNVAEYYGANDLDCFDGFLTEFYQARGWIEYSRIPNWTPDQPDVVHMYLP